MPFDERLRKPTPPASRGDQQYKSITGIVYDLIADGIENVTMRQVAGAARVSLGMTAKMRSQARGAINEMFDRILSSSTRLPEIE